MRLHGSHVGHLVDVTTHTLGLRVTNQVVVVTPIDIEVQVQSVVQETSIQTEVELVLLLVGQLRVGNLAQRCNGLHLVTLRTPGVH